MVHTCTQVTILWFFFTLLVSVLMLNLLIAMMATTFERIADQQKEEYARSRALAHSYARSKCTGSTDGEEGDSLLHPLPPPPSQPCTSPPTPLPRWALQRAHFTLEAERMYSFFRRTRPPHHNCDPEGRWWLLMEDTHSAQYDHLAPPVEPPSDQPHAYSLIGGGRPEKVVHRRSMRAGAPAPRTTMRAPRHEMLTPTLRRGESLVAESADMEAARSREPSSGCALLRSGSSSMYPGVQYTP